MLVEIPDNELDYVAGSIAHRRFWSHCDCDNETGYTCEFCRKRFGIGSDYDWHEVVRVWRDFMLARWKKDANQRTKQ